MSRVAEVLVPERLGTGFRWLLASSWTTNLGDGIALAAGPLLVASQTSDPLLVALAGLLQRLPRLPTQAEPTSQRNGVPMRTGSTASTIRPTRRRP